MGIYLLISDFYLNIHTQGLYKISEVLHVVEKHYLGIDI